MGSAFRTPQHLVEGLHDRQPDARLQLHELFLEPIQRLMGELIARHQLDADRDMLVTNALYLAETIIRLRAGSSFAELSWPAFRASLLLQLTRLVLQPYGISGSPSSSSPPALPISSTYHSETFFRPSAQVGTYFFGGDWYAGHRLLDGSLWVFLADVTGHGYYAYLLATALPAIWQRCWAAHEGTTPQPTELLQVMHDLLADCMPDGIFLECTLLCLRPDGSAIVVPAGGVRMLLQPARQSADVMKLRGAWLGLRAPTPEEQHTLSLDEGDEIVLTTDGVFDQLATDGGAEAITRKVSTRAGALFAALREALDHSVSTTGQKDDITMVLVRRQELSPAGVDILPFSGARGG
jgi:serine phosphatase RsbU (regulator of sigma subunit)